LIFEPASAFIFQTGGLRQTLVELERDVKIGKVSANAFAQKKLEVLAALERLGDQLSVDEKDFLEKNSTSSIKQFVQGPILQNSVSAENFFLTSF
jgi:hypothetical protein